MQPEESLAIADRVKRLLRRHQVGERKQAGQLAVVLQISVQSVYKKLDGQMQWSLDDILAIARAMGERPGMLLDDNGELDLEPGVLNCNGAALECLVRVGGPTNGPPRTSYVAFRDGELWQVYVAGHAPNSSLTAVEEIVIRSPQQAVPASPRIAIIDDDPDTAELIAHFLATKGFQTVVLDSAENLRIELQQQAFDGYLIDWDLGGLTAEDCVRLIKQSSHNNQAPILLLTGNIDTGRASESDIARVMVEFGLRHPFEKPYRVEIIAAELRKEIGVGV